MRNLRRWLGVGTADTRDRDKLFAGVGAALTILAVHALSLHVVGSVGAAVMVPSMGATAVLLFTAPRSPLSQPWPVIGGHVVSAVVGVGCARAISNRDLAAGVAVGAAIVAMQLLRCLHPPGGATALAAVIGGPAVTSLGWSYVLRPVALDVVLVVVIGSTIGLLHPDGWLARREPRRTGVPRPQPDPRPQPQPQPATEAPFHTALLAALDPPDERRWPPGGQHG